MSNLAQSNCRYTQTKLHYFFFFNDTATTEIYTLSLHDALPILQDKRIIIKVNDKTVVDYTEPDSVQQGQNTPGRALDRKSTRLNSSHSQISYAVFCLKKKKKKKKHTYTKYKYKYTRVASYSHQS